MTQDLSKVSCTINSSSNEMIIGVQIDGHAEIHRWKDQTTLQPISGTYRHGGLAVPRNQDFHFVWQRATKNKLEP
jgi:hypothetical protein